MVPFRLGETCKYGPAFIRNLPGPGPREMHFGASGKRLLPEFFQGKIGFSETIVISENLAWVRCCHKQSVSKNDQIKLRPPDSTSVWNPQEIYYGSFPNARLRHRDSSNNHFLTDNRRIETLERELKKKKMTPKVLL